MKLSQVVARIALAGCFLAAGMTDATADESTADAPAQTPSVEVAVPMSVESTTEAEVVDASPAEAMSATAEAEIEEVSEVSPPATVAADVTLIAPLPESPEVPVVQAKGQEGAVAASESNAVGTLATTQKASRDAKKKNPWDGSYVAYGFGFSAISLDKASDQTWNPEVAHTLAFEPHWRFHDYLGLRLRLEVQQELTNSDETTKRFEWWWSDLNVDVTAGKGYTEPVTGIKVNGGLRFGLPVSKASQARTMILALSPNLSVSRKFPILAGLTVAYSGRFTYQFHQSTTAQYDGTSLSCGDPDSIHCEPFLNTGLRNAQTIWSHGPSVSLDIFDNLSFTLSYTLRRSGLYALDDYEIYDRGSGIYLGTLEPGENDITARHGQAFEMELEWAPIDLIHLVLSVSTVYADLRENGSYQTPLFNRFTTIAFGIGLDIDSVIQAFK